MEIQNWIDKGIDFIFQYGPKILGAIIFWIIGSWIIKMIMKAVRKGMRKANYDESLQKFIGNLIYWILKAVLIISILGTLGVETTSIAAILAAAGLAIGMALQGSLANFAGGVLIMLFKPFKVGDLIETQGFLGHVKEIQIFVTKLVSLDNKEIILPNGKLSNENLGNLTTEGKLRVDLNINVGFGEDLAKAREALMSVMNNDDQVLKSPAPSVSVEAIGDTAVKLAVRPYATVDDYWDVYFGTLEKGKKALNEAGINIPYPKYVIDQA